MVESVPKIAVRSSRPIVCRRVVHHRCPLVQYLVEVRPDEGQQGQCIHVGVGKSHFYNDGFCGEQDGAYYGNEKTR